MVRTVFDKIVTNENSFTELFKNFLRFGAFRRFFLELLDTEFDIDSVTHDDFDTQLTISEYGRPDLVLTTDEIEIFFEIKVYNSTLTENQPIGYYNYLKGRSKASTKGLVLIIPESYNEIESYEASLLGIKSSSDDIFTQVIHWEKISKIITDNELENISTLFGEYSSFLINWFQLRPVFYDSLDTTTMSGTHFPESLKKTMSIIDGQYNEFLKRGYLLKWARRAHFTEYGFYFIMPNTGDELFIGIWLDYWASSGNPICIALSSESSVRSNEFVSAVQSLGLDSASKFTGWVVTSIGKQELMDEKCSQKMTKTISGLLTKMSVNPKVKE